MTVRILVGDAREMLGTLAAGSVQCCVTSPPYFGLRDYGVPGQIGLEASPESYVAELVAVFAEVRRVLADDGVLWLVIGDSYAGSATVGRNDAARLAVGAAGGHGGGITAPRMGDHSGRQKRGPTGCKPKDLLMIPARVALALQADGWWLRSHCVWVKPNPMPESVRDRPTNAHESVFLLSKRARYAYYNDAVREPNCATVQRALERYKDDPRIAEARRKGNKGTAPDRADSQKTLRIDNNAFGNPAGRNMRNVWTITPKPFRGAHFATFPPELARRCILAGSKPGDTILDPFFGAGTAALAAPDRDCIGVDISPAYAELARARLIAAGLTVEPIEGLALPALEAAE